MRDVLVMSGQGISPGGISNTGRPSGTLQFCGGVVARRLGLFFAHIGWYLGPVAPKTAITRYFGSMAMFELASLV